MIDINNKIIILEDNVKNDFISNINSLVNVKIITLSELKKKYCFDYKKEAVVYVSKKYNVIYDVAKIIINNLYYINDNCDDEKVLYLNTIKNDLIENKLLIENNMFKSFLKNKDIILYNLKYVDKFYENIFNEIRECSNVTCYDDEKEKSITDVYEANNIEEEVSFIACKICELIKNGVDINRIKLANVSSEYVFAIKKIFSMFNININLDSSDKIKGTNIVKKFEELFENDINKTIEELKKSINTYDDNEIFKQIINKINEYSFCDDYESVKEYLFSDIENIKKKAILYDNSVNCVDINTYNCYDDYIFLMNFNEGVIPFNNKDEDYLSDNIKSKLNISTSYELNKLSTNNLQNKIGMFKNLVITYSNSDNKGTIFISPLYNEQDYYLKKVEYNYTYSDAYNKLKLVSLKDSYVKFGSVSDELYLLNTHYNNEKYSCFDNSYKNIDKDKLYNYIKNSLLLSYSSMNKYYECKFKYYLDCILRLNKFEDTFEITVGNIFHKILSECFCDEFDFDGSWNFEINNSKYEFSISDKYFLKILKEELLLIIETIKNQLNCTQLNKSMYEKEIIVNVNSDLHITFKGYIDKILYDEFNGQTICAIVDYKTGNPELNINNTLYGLEMQLPVYIYLIKNSDIKNVRIGGFYLQKILNNKFTIDEKIDSLKLQGYSNSDLNVLEKVDTSYNSSKIIKSLKTTSNGFYAYSKIINDDEIDYLSNLVSDRINEASNGILNTSFEINPKEIDGNNISCKYCKYKDICYMKNDNVVSLNKINNIFELRGEVDANLD